MTSLHSDRPASGPAGSPNHARRAFCLGALASVATGPALAHPGHEGGHPSITLAVRLLGARRVDDAVAVEIAFANGGLLPIVVRELSTPDGEIVEDRLPLVLNAGEAVLWNGDEAIMVRGIGGDVESFPLDIATSNASARATVRIPA